MSCKGCFNIKNDCCENQLISIGLTANMPYKLHLIKPRFTTVYVIEGTTNNDGDINLEKTKLPDGYLSKGFIKGFVYDEDDNIVNFTVNSVVYNCFIIELVDFKSV